LRKALVLLAAVASVIAATASIGVDMASANGACPGPTYSSVSRLSSPADSYSGTLRLLDGDRAGGGKVSFAVGGPTGGYYLAVFLKKETDPPAPNAKSFSFGVESNNPNVADAVGFDFFFSSPYDDSVSFTISKDPPPYPGTWSATAGDQTISHFSLGGSANWAQVFDTQPSETPCQVMTQDVTVNGANLSTWYADNNLGSWYTTSLLNSNHTFRTIQSG
jgi:hypothetical protein